MAARRNDARDLQNLVNAFFRLGRPARSFLLAVVVAAAVIAFFYWQHRARAPQFTGSPHLLLGNPSGASADPAHRDNYLMGKANYALSYNNSKGTANWVSWRVSREDLGHAQRKPTFDADDSLPTGFYRVTHKDYSGSGFDRGHLCPHADRAATREMAWSTFIMTNIIPQAPNVNEKAWANMEEYCRGLVRQSNRLYIVAGPAGAGGRGSNGPHDTIAHGRVSVPAQCWKVVVVVPEAGGDNDLAKIGPVTRVITVNMPNDNDEVGEDWAIYRTTPAEIEKRTGFQFFGNLAPEVAQGLRQQLDSTPIPGPR